MKKALGAALAVVLLIAVTALITWVFFPRKEVTGIPHIVQTWDTVEVIVPRLDTVWRTRVVSQVETLPNVIDTVTVVAVPETVHTTTTDTIVEYQCPQQLQVGQYGKREKPTTLEGLTLSYDTAKTLLSRPWRVTYFTPGPLDAAVFDTFPPVMTFRPRPNECSFLCRLGLVSLGTLGGAVVTGTACLVSHGN